MRYIAYASGILAGALVVTVAIGHLPRVANASLEGPTLNVLQFEQTSDAKAVPTQQIADEVYR
jgi:hypothetical protein